MSKKQQNIIACIPAYNALSVILHYAVALDEGADPVKLGLTTIEDRGHAYLQCVDPWKPYTEGGTVIFRIRKVK